MGFYVYQGTQNGKIVYIGTTTQEPEARFRWHRANGKNLNFSIVAEFDTSDEMLDHEFMLIQKHKPVLNKITKRRQNLNRKLSQADLDKRVGDDTWCQRCLKRRVNPGYKICFYCS